MISICIPTYNYDAAPLVEQLLNSIHQVDIKAEIIVLDDCSDANFKELNQNLAQHELVSYTWMNQNLGRSAIRNSFLLFAQYEYLLFIDVDSLLPTPQFLKYYVDAIAENHSVICGGTAYRKSDLTSNTALRWHYGNQREAIAAKRRNLHSNEAFAANNFCIKKSVLDKVRFRKLPLGYGHEDTILGLELAQQEFVIYHIDNPVYHVGLESAQVFLDKTETAVQNLKQLGEDPRWGLKLQKSIRLLKWYHAIQLLNLTKPIRWLLNLLMPAVQINLKSKYPIIKALDAFKLWCLLK